MYDRMTEKRDEIEIDFKRLFITLLRKAWLIGLVCVACGVGALLGTFLFVKPLYQSTAMFYVNNTPDDPSSGITSADITASRGLVKSYIVILNSRETLTNVIDYAGVDRSYGELREMVCAAAVDSTEFFEVVVTSPDPREAETIANAIVQILPIRIADIMEGTFARIVDAAVASSTPSSPDYRKNLMAGMVAGFALSAGVIVLWVLLDTTIRSEADIIQSCSCPVLAVVPDMMTSGRGSDRAQRKKIGGNSGEKTALIGGGLSFAAAEAYKLLRTKLKYSFAGESASRVIGISSALSGEGKSLSAINLAYTLSQRGCRVVVIDCDMRRPTLAEKLRIRKSPGLSGFLTGQSVLKDVLQACDLEDMETAFYVIPAGATPPNPIELLSSEKMTELITALRKMFAYVILDLPPVGEVSDALAAAENTDGILLVARQDHGDCIALREAVRQFAFVNAKVLGVILNCANENSGKYRKYYHRKYRRKKTGGRYMAHSRHGKRKAAKHV